MARAMASAMVVRPATASTIVARSSRTGSEQSGGEQALGATGEDERLDCLPAPVAHTKHGQRTTGEQKRSAQPARSICGCDHGCREHEAAREELAGSEQLASPAQPQHQAGALVVL